MSLLESNVEVRREDLRLPYERAARARVAGYPQHPQFVPSGQTQSGKYTTRFAQSLADLDRVLRLRFQIFNEELGEGLDASIETRRDEDAFDAQCHHLMVVATETDELVGMARAAVMALSPSSSLRAS